MTLLVSLMDPTPVSYMPLIQSKVVEEQEQLIYWL